MTTTKTSDVDTRPVVVAIEGADGSGKTRHVRAAVEALGRAGYTARAFHHPAPPEGYRDPAVIALWYAEKRRTLLSALANGDVVVADRWFWSTLALRAGICLAQPEGYWSTVVSMLDVAEDEADTTGWGRVATRFDDTLPIVTANIASSRVPVRMALIVLDAPDGVLDDRVAARGEPLWPVRVGERAFYRRATCVDTSQETADTIVPRLVRWAVDGIRMGAL